MKSKLFVIIVLVSLSVLLAACSSAPTSLDVKMDDFSYAPHDMTIAAGKEITVSVTNDGKEEHEFVIFKLGKDAGDAFGPEDEDNIFWEVEAVPGETKTEKFMAPSEPGEYYITCGIEDHLQEGMVAKLTVK